MHETRQPQLALGRVFLGGILDVGRGASRDGMDRKAVWGVMKGGGEGLMQRDSTEREGRNLEGIPRPLLAVSACIVDTH